MGQATADPPKPASAPPPVPATTDDLLSQLAGEEIDRLLAESASQDGSTGVDAPSPGAVSETATRDVPDAAIATPNDFDAFGAGTTFESPSTDDSALEVAAELDAQPVSAPFPIVPESGAAPRQPSLIIRLLELLSAPLDFCPPGARQILGKVAIVTFVNAVAVLIYVAIFRRH